mmetsp:Transcript_92651/g.183886  ORF Transcript_92651/g.183886 Transcript_92651/m.183886 type:complete len:81 (-) Transcript_92651:65-307(-)
MLLTPLLLAKPQLSGLFRYPCTAVAGAASQQTAVAWLRQQRTHSEQARVELHLATTIVWIGLPLPGQDTAEQRSQNKTED